MQIITKENIQSIFSMQNAISASKEALQLYSSQKTKTPLRQVMEMEKQNGQSLLMPAYVESLNIYGVKLVSVHPENIKSEMPSVNATMMLFNATNGDLIALLDGTYLTQLRTGALQGAATDLLARPDSKIGLLIGTGGQAATQLEAMLTVRNLEEVRVFDLDFNRAKQFAKDMQSKFHDFNTKIIAAADCDHAIMDADIITTITTSKKPVFNGNLIKQGAHVNGIGAYTREMQELPEAILHRAQKIVFDTKEGVLSEAGDIIIPMERNNFPLPKNTQELGEMLLENSIGRQHQNDITVFKAVGSAILDLITAFRIYEKTKERDMVSYEAEESI